MTEYSGIFLDNSSRSKLLSKFKVPDGWTPYADHLTISLGELPINLKQKIGMSYKLKITKIGVSKTNIAFGVETNLDTKNKTPHITFAVDREHGGRQQHSNQITKWKNIKPFYVTGKLNER
jgi:hypothetical protein